MAPDTAALMAGVQDAVAAASTAILEVYASAHGVEYKADESPITRADRAAHDILSARLDLLAPAIPVLSEEADAAHDPAVRRGWRELWLVDPLDGTKEFSRPRRSRCRCRWPRSTRAMTIGSRRRSSTRASR